MEDFDMEDEGTGFEYVGLIDDEEICTFETEEEALEWCEEQNEKCPINEATYEVREIWDND